jgi:hypothetical protein
LARGGPTRSGRAVSRAVPHRSSLRLILFAVPTRDRGALGPPMPPGQGTSGSARGPGLPVSGSWSRQRASVTGVDESDIAGASQPCRSASALGAHAKGVRSMATRRQRPSPRGRVARQRLRSRPGTASGGPRHDVPAPRQRSTNTEIRTPSCGRPRSRGVTNDTAASLGSSRIAMHALGGTRNFEPSVDLRSDCSSEVSPL